MSSSSHSSTITINKSDDTANKHRETGNSHYARREWLEALIYYNKSITFANSKKEISLGYANRSAVYFELKRYEDCLKNIEWARENKYQKKEKLMEREEKCKKLMGKEKQPEDPWNFFKLSYPANEKIPWIADCLEMRTTQKYGRGIYATKDLKAGDVVCLEEPILQFFRDVSEDVSDAYYMHCSNCFKTCMMNLIPCVRTALMMFCSKECRQALYAKGLNDITFMCDNVKTLAVIMDGFNGKKDFEKFLKANNNNLKKIKRKTIFDYNLSNPEDPKYKENLVTCLLSLESMKNFAIGGCCLSQNYLSESSRNHILGIRRINQQNTFYYDGEYAARHSGASISLFVSLLNHSCVPNVHSFSVNNKVAVVVLRPIKAGEQLFRCYFNSLTHLLDKFEMILQYEFNCDCKACTDEDVNRFFPVRLWMAPSTFMTRENLDEAKEYLKEGYYYINKNSKSPEEIIRYVQINYSILDTLAYYCTFPC